MLKLGLWRQGAMQLVRASSPYLAAPPRREDACAMPYPRRSSPIRHGNRHSGDDGDASPLPGQSLASGVHVGRYLTSWSQHDLRRGSTVLDIGYGNGSAVSGLRARGHAACGIDPTPELLEVAVNNFDSDWFREHRSACARFVLTRKLRPLAGTSTPLGQILPRQ